MTQAFPGWLTRYDLRISPQPVNSWVWITLCMIFLVSIAMRVHSLDRSFWLDEVWMANAVMAPTFSQMVYYEGWLNTSPPLFSLLVRFATQLFGVSHESMRLVPVVFGIVSIPAMSYLALRLLKPRYALLAVLFLALSSDHIVSSQSVKQYTADVFVSLILLILGYHILTTRSRNVFYAAITTFSICGFLSYQAIVFLPVLFYTACFDCQRVNRLQDWRNTINIRWIDLIVLISITCSVSAINYFYFVQSNYESKLTEVWTHGFYHGTSVLEFIHYVLAAFANLTHPIHPTIRSYFLLRLVALAIILAGVVGFVFRQEGRREMVVLLGLPILSLIVLNLLGQYPISRAPRLQLFILPVTAILFAAGTQFLIGLGALLAGTMKRSASVTAKIEDVLTPLVLVVIAFLFGTKLSFAGLSPYFWLNPREDAEAAIRYLSEQHSDGELLYIHSTMREHYKFYSKSLPISGGRVVEGTIGWPCCPRGVSNDRRGSPAEAMSAELARLNLSNESGNVRLFFTNRQYHWDTLIGRDEPHEFESRLSGRGCIRTQTKEFTGIRIDEYRCRPSSSPHTSTSPESSVSALSL